jgi:hypothetical protein
MGSWIWVAPGIVQPPPQLPESHPSTDDSDHETAIEVDVSAVGKTISDPHTIDLLNPDPHNSALIRIKVLGSVEVDPELPPPRRSVVLELACYLALHRRRPVTTEELQIALSGNDAGPETSAKSVRTYMSELRRWLGTEHVPPARGSGYRFAERVTSDWDEFRSLALLRLDDPYEQIGPLAEALNLVRGRPFTGTNYRWVDAELLVSEMEVAIGDVARRLGAIGADQGLAEIAFFAGRRAALACPYDLGLWEMALEGAAGYDAKELAQTWHDARVALGDEAATLEPVARRLGLT